MKSDRHIALRILVQGATPLALLLGIFIAGPTGFGLGGPIAAGLMISVAIGLFALVFGFPALARAAPLWAMTLLIGLALAAALAAVLIPPEAAAVALERLGVGADEARAAIIAQAFGIAAGALIVGAALVMLQAIGARAQPLTLEDAR